MKLSNKKLIGELAEYLEGRIRERGYFSVDDIDKGDITAFIFNFVEEKLRREADSFIYY